MCSMLIGNGERGLDKWSLMGGVDEKKDEEQKGGGVRMW